MLAGLLIIVPFFDRLVILIKQGLLIGELLSGRTEEVVVVLLLLGRGQKVVELVQVGTI